MDCGHFVIKIAQSINQSIMSSSAKGPQHQHQRKLARKKTKFVNIVLKDVGLQITDTPSCWVIVWGFGLECGTTKNDIQEMFEKPEEIRFVKDKSYCFLRYGDVRDATRVKEKNETEFFSLALREKDPVKRFIGFVNEEPPAEDLSLIDNFVLSEPPQGFELFRNFVTPEEEMDILSKLMESFHGDNPSASDPEHGTKTKTLKHRWVRHFGYEFRYGTNDVDVTEPLQEAIPSYLQPVLTKMDEEGVFFKSPEQLTVNRYQPGQGIPPHVDTHSCFESPIVSLSLGSDIVMHFRNGDRVFSTILPARSLLVMRDEARYGWTHGISNRTFDIVPCMQEDPLRAIELNVLPRGTRLSLTFRHLRNPRQCNCPFPEMCDSQKGKISEENAAELEKKMVHNVYEDIASHFHETRHTPWPRVKEFITSLEEGSVILDIGCGNGKYFNLNQGVIQIGTDMSSMLLSVCREKEAEVLRVNALQLPFKDGICQAVICIAVLHHVSTPARRLHALSEIFRVLSTGGQALIYVWAKNQHHLDEGSVFASKQSCSKDYSLDICDRASAEFSFLPIHNRQADFEDNDLLVPWVNKGKGVHHRYYHVFDEGELEKLIDDVEVNAKIVESYYDQGNWVVRVLKL